jgi:glyoxylase-like metal-dependent hydrolase (beta-lactamase superfamily II)
MKRVILGAAGVLVVLATAGVIALRHGRHRFLPPVTVRPNLMQVHNSFVDFYGIRAGKRVVLIDTGVDPSGRALDGLLAALGARRDDVSDVFLTHGHGDHVAAATLCPRARVHIGIRDADMAAHTAPTVPGRARLIGRLIPVAAVHATDGLIDRAELTLPDSERLLALPLPGHTPGSFAYLWSGVLFVGDSIQVEGGRLMPADPGFSVDAAENRRSLATLRQSLRGAEVQWICTGHQGCVTALDDQKHDRLDELIERVSMKVRP